jgi:hypothetical protein
VWRNFPAIREIGCGESGVGESIDGSNSSGLYEVESGEETLLEQRDVEGNLSVVAPEVGRGLLLDGVTSVTLDGLVVTGGVAAGTDPEGHGGGIACFNANATNRILNCRILGNSSQASQGFGGGIYCYRSSPMIENCVIAGNHAVGSEPLGLYVLSPRFSQV